MAKKPTQKKTPTPEYDPTRQQNVLLEQISKDVKTVAEGHSVLRSEIDKINNKLEGHDKRFDRIEMAVSEVGIKVKQNATKIDELNTKVDKIDKKLDTVTTGHEHRIQKLEALR